MSDTHIQAGAGIVDDATFDVLNAIYLHKMSTAQHIAEVVEQSVDDVLATLHREEADTSVCDVGPGWLLETAGTAKVLAFYREKYAGLRADGDIIHWYEKFESTLNQQFIKAVSEWQTSEGDGKAQEKMVRLVDRMIRHLGQVTDRIPRYRFYAERFQRAMAKADRGESQFVCKPTVDSMHNIWFEFHEDILAVVGRPRDV
ncbi:hypothetical protein FHR90_003218 [Endobacter medicaginis]|uniref:Uncharacterized protein n=1 Tax=Endobacter medicaginis TaxID=1181271 RepID=A0A839V4J7_9PROT|nr:hypothetical protein [Endobacter medicaginis]MBB3175364.1 hypothetical protein [Endobacter medicaginis]MCX5476544.1 hypothetical protein [Endobacter medicaginis]NVN29201.1 hypothetical protein [Endobacter medicaginis]